MTHAQMVEAMRQAYRVAALSPDLSTKNGGVLVTRDGRYRVSGCNRIVPASCVTPERLQRPLKYQWTTHAEADCICQAARRAFPTFDATLVCCWAACCDCAKLIVGAGIRHVVRHHHAAMDARPDWQASIKVGDEMFEAAGIEVVTLTEKLGVTTLFDGNIIEV